MTNKNKWLITVGSLIATATAFFFIKKKKTSNEDKPPKGAPQLNIENPGSQHEFPKSPIESELG